MHVRPPFPAAADGPSLRRPAGLRFAALLGALAAIVAAFAAPGGAVAAELLMVEEDGCHWCARWDQEIGVIYHKTEEGRIAPLRRVDIAAPPADIRFASRLVYTPTFVLVVDGEEIGRIEGHPGEDFFWPLLGRLLGALPDGEGT